MYLSSVFCFFFFFKCIYIFWDCATVPNSVMRQRFVVQSVAVLRVHSRCCLIEAMWKDPPSLGPLNETLSSTIPGVTFLHFQRQGCISSFIILSLWLPSRTFVMHVSGLDIYDSQFWYIFTSRVVLQWPFRFHVWLSFIWNAQEYQTGNFCQLCFKYGDANLTNSTETLGTQKDLKRILSQNVYAFPFQRLPSRWGTVMGVVHRAPVRLAPQWCMLSAVSPGIIFSDLDVGVGAERAAAGRSQPQRVANAGCLKSDLMAGVPAGHQPLLRPLCKADHWATAARGPPAASRRHLLTSVAAPL